MSFRSNATKPQYNKSKIVDLVKKAFNTSLSVCVPENDNVSSTFMQNGPNNTYRYDIKTISVLSLLAESKLFNNFMESFDTFKIVDTHFCIDVASLPVVKISVDAMKCIVDSELMVRDPNTGLFVSIDNSPLTDVQKAALTASLPQRDRLYTGAQTEVMIEVPFVVAAAVQRTVPRGYYDSEQYQNINWDQLMSFGSTIWQSKMPGAGIHLSLDSKGSSNSERMMTFPTDVVRRLYTLNPMLQNGRYCPFVHLGVRVDNLTDDQLQSQIVNSISNGILQYELAGTIGLQYKFSNNYQFIRWTPDATAQPPVYYDLRLLTRFSIEGMTPQEKAAHLIVDNHNLGYNLSIQSYTNVIFKQVRHSANVGSFIYSLYGYILRGLRSNLSGDEEEDYESVEVIGNGVKNHYDQDKFNIWSINFSKGNGGYDFDVDSTEGGRVMFMVLFTLDGDFLVATVLRKIVDGFIQPMYLRTDDANNEYTGALKTLIDSYDHVITCVVQPGDDYEQTANYLNGLKAYEELSVVLTVDRSVDLVDDVVLGDRGFQNVGDALPNFQTKTVRVFRSNIVPFVDA